MSEIEADRALTKETKGKEMVKWGSDTKKIEEIPGRHGIKERRNEMK